MANRYLLYISYIGTNYRGLQKGPNISKNESIQSAIEAGLIKLLPKNGPSNLCLSSRTDKGVHAITNTVHVHLDHPTPGCVYSPDLVTNTVNKSLNRHNHQITVKKTLLVPKTFHCRANTLWRRYVYRLAILKEHPETSCSHSWKIFPYTPITERFRTWILKSDVSVDSMRSVCRVYRGTHDFATFKGSAGHINVDTVKHIEEFDLRPSTPVVSATFDPLLYDNLNFYDVHVKARSFLNKQVRRMVGAMVAVGNGRISLDELRWMLDNPNKKNWLPSISLAPSYGLYLTDIHYNPQDMIFDRQPGAEENTEFDSQNSSDSVK